MQRRRPHFPLPHRASPQVSADDMSNWRRVAQVLSGSSCCASKKYAAAPVTPRELKFTKGEKTCPDNTHAKFHAPSFFRR